MIILQWLEPVISCFFFNQHWSHGYVHTCCLIPSVHNTDDSKLICNSLMCDLLLHTCMTCCGRQSHTCSSGTHCGTFVTHEYSMERKNEPTVGLSALIHIPYTHTTCLFLLSYFPVLINWYEPDITKNVFVNQSTETHTVCDAYDSVQEVEEKLSWSDTWRIIRIKRIIGANESCSHKTPEEHIWAKAAQCRRVVQVLNNEQLWSTAAGADFRFYQLLNQRVQLSFPIRNVECALGVFKGDMINYSCLFVVCAHT